MLRTRCVSGASKPVAHEMPQAVNTRGMTAAFHPVLHRPAALVRVRLAARTPLSPTISRVRLEPVGPEDEATLAATPAGSPDDRIKLFLPDPATGYLVPPRIAPDGAIVRAADAVSISRDFTRIDPQVTGDSGAIELDTVSFATPGPATAWLHGHTEHSAELGAEAVVALPRASRALPVAADVERALLVADETGIAALSGMLAALDPAIRVTAIVIGDEDGYESALDAGLAARGSIEWLYRIDGPGQLEEAVRSVPLGERDWLWAVGEASELAAVRRNLPGALPAERAEFTGYWRRGRVNFDPDEQI